MKAVLFGLRSFGKDFKSILNKVLWDNSIAVACINKCGTSRSLECNSLAQEIWARAAKVKIWPTRNLHGMDSKEVGLPVLM